MTLADFVSSTVQPEPPAGIGPALEALWHVRKGNWNRAHEIVQAHEGAREYAAIHAHLHRIEGDAANAGYWYRRAGNKPAEVGLEQEWQALAGQFLREID